MADVMEVEERVTLILTRNASKIYEQYFETTAATYTRHASDRLVLPAGMSTFQEASLGDINSTNLGKHMMAVVDREILIAVNTTAQQVSADMIMMKSVSNGISHVYFKNTDADNTATVEFVVSDQNV